MTGVSAAALAVCLRTGGDRVEGGVAWLVVWQEVKRMNAAASITTKLFFFISKKPDFW
jgi:hypothetical protein